MDVESDSWVAAKRMGAMERCCEWYTSSVVTFKSSTETKNAI